MQAAGSFAAPPGKREFRVVGDQRLDTAAIDHAQGLATHKVLHGKGDEFAGHI